VHNLRQRVENELRSNILPFWLLTLSFGIALTRAAIEWSESALANLAASKAGAALGSKKKASLKAPSPRGRM
jgi:hypothetical protein